MLGSGLELLFSIFRLTDPGDIAVRHSAFRQFASDPIFQLEISGVTNYPSGPFGPSGPPEGPEGHYSLR